MKRLRIVIFPSIAVVVLAALLVAGWQSASAVSGQHGPQLVLHKRACGSWSVVASPNVGTSSNFLSGVAALSAKNVWAVGSEGNGHGGFTLVEHWTGSKWKGVASLNVKGSLSDSLSGVAALATNNIWAVGSYFDASNVQHPLIEHWNGTSWSIVSSPSGGLLNGVAAFAANNIWAIGSTTGSSVNGYVTLIEHYNGTSWSVVPGSSVSGGQLFGVTALATNNVWAVGNVAVNGNLIQTLIEHWNGTSWSVVSSSGPGLASNTLSSVASLAANNIWAVGDDTNSVGPSAQYVPLVEHWNGTSWSVVSSPVQGTSDLINGIAAVSANNLWAVGDYRSGLDPQGPYYTLIEHWNGTSWSVVTSPSPGVDASDLSSAASVPKTSSVWSVGFTQDVSYQTLTEYYC
ncbi:MAG TPA: hypothetical protein DHW02_24290 [Ktedonobacter sp.]|nr:hypothetical protein [Ktedonobacter sp.]